MSRASASIEAMILFLGAMLVVVGAAMVMVAQQGAFLNQMHFSTSEGRKAILTQFSVEHVSADLNDFNRGQLAYFFLTGRLASQSPDLPMSEMVLVIETGSSITTRDYNASTGMTNADCKAAANSNTVFSMRPLRDGGSRTVLKADEPVEFCWHEFPGLEVDTKLLIRVLPKNGSSPTSLEVVTPGVFDRNTVNLYP